MPEDKKIPGLIFLLGLLSAIGPFSIDMYLPGFPDIAAGLHTSVAKISLSLSSFFIGISAGQLLYGPLLDKYGRRRPLFFGLSLYLAASVGCALSPAIEWLIFFRFLQALGGCVGMVASRAMVRELFHVKDNAKIFSMLMLVVGVSPLIAPTLGGYVAASLGWRFIFAVLSLLSAFILVSVYLRLPERENTGEQYSLRPGSILKNFLAVLKEPQFITYALTGSVASAGLYAYISGSPYVFMELFHVTERQYGWIFALVAMALIGASQLNTVLLKGYKSEQVVKVALFFQSVAGILLLLGAIFNILELFSTIFLIAVFLGCQGFTFPNTSALSLAPFFKNAGSASAMLGAIQMTIGAGTSALVSVLNNHTAIPMTGVMAACALTSFTILMIGSRLIRYRASVEEVEEQTAEMITTS